MEIHYLYYAYFDPYYTYIIDYIITIYLTPTEKIAYWAEKGKGHIHQNHYRRTSVE